MFVMHYICPAPAEAKAPLDVAPGPLLPSELTGGREVPFSPGGRFVIACGLPHDRTLANPQKFGGPGFFDGIIHRATGETYAGVSCRGCLASIVFAKNKVLHPRDQPAPDVAVASLPGCCE
jgi:hypothetical protein